MQIPKLNPFHFCTLCSSEHEYFKERCTQCGLCYKTCVRVDSGCKWFEPPAHTTPIPSITNDADGVVNTANLPAYENLKGAFESWVVSSTKLDLERPPEELWTEFEIFAKEVLTPVDYEKNYLQIDAGTGKFKTLDAKKLYRNQDNDYVILENKKRIRIGKTVAVLG